MVKCSVRLKVFRHLCVNISVDQLNLFEDGNNGFDWSCINCRKIGHELKDLKSLILTLQSEIQDLKSNSRGPNNSQTSVDFEQVIQEINERNKRRRNLILYGLPEQDQQLSSAMRIDKDESQVRGIISTVDQALVTDHFKPVRLGRYNEAKVRPIRITLQHDNDVFLAMKNAKSLKTSRYKHISISFDRTLKQRQYFKEVKAELDIKNASGTEKYRIKHVDGIPKIVPLNLN
nr:unnamed protein product [Callosobruchus chinensis]